MARWVRVANLANNAIANAFLSSAEFRSRQVEAYYVVLLHRPADSGGRAAWVNSGLDLAAIRIAILSSPESFVAS